MLSTLANAIFSLWVVFYSVHCIRALLKSTYCRLRAKGQLKPSESIQRQSKKMHVYCTESRARLPAVVPP